MASNSRRSSSMDTSSESTGSHMSILNFRESMQNSIMGTISSDSAMSSWYDRLEFVFTALLYCLNMGSLWRLPTQVIRYGGGAFLYVYLFFCILFAIPLLFFEVSLGQYTNKGLMGVFHSVPMLEGISYAMIFFCNTVIHVYQQIEVYNYFYLFTFIRTHAPLSGRTNYGRICFHKNHTSSFETLHFLNEVVMVSDDLNCEYNLRNLCILLFLWMFIWVHSSKEFFKKKEIIVKIYAFVIIALFITLFNIMKLPGSGKGLARLFLPSLSNFTSYKMYFHAFEQSLTTFGLGMGPIINFGSRTPFRSPIHVDTIIVSVGTILASVLMSMIIFSTIGIYTAEVAGHSDPNLAEQEYYFHVLLAKSFGKMPFGIKNVNIVLFFGALFTAGQFASLMYFDLLSHFLHHKLDINPNHNTQIMFLLCCLHFCVGSIMMTHYGFRLLYWSATQVFTVLSVSTLMAMETIAVCFIYTTKTFCEDVEFMTGYYPNLWYKSIWNVTPFFCLGTIVLMITESYLNGVNWYDGFACLVYVVAVIVPVASHAILFTFKKLRKTE